MNDVIFKGKIKAIIGNENPDVASQKLIELFNEHKRFRLSFLDGQGFEQETRI